MSHRTLYLAWQDRFATRAWYPIGRLDVNEIIHEFSYTRGALTAQAQAGFQALPSFPDLKRRYKSDELFSFFRNRLLGSSRQDFAGYLDWLGMSEGQFDPLEVLAVTGGERQTDNFEVFSKIKKESTGHFKCRFFLHGQRHVHESARQRIESFRVHEPLRICLEYNNPATSRAVQLQTEDYVMIGWAPRYLVGDLAEAALASGDLGAKIVKVNTGRVPANMRVLIELVGRLPPNYEPMVTDEFRLIDGQVETSAAPLAN